jgi:hypothetical protein
MDVLRWYHDHQQDEQAGDHQAGPPSGPGPDRAAAQPDDPQK